MPINLALYDMSSVHEKVQRQISSRNLASHMNNTKWGLLLPALKDIALRIDVKWLLQEEPNGWTTQYLIPSPTYFEPLPLGPVTFRELEWLLIDPIEIELAKSHLAELKIPFSLEGRLLKVWGYSSHAVNFV